jgi:hypothetical protein
MTQRNPFKAIKVMFRTKILRKKESLSLRIEVKIQMKLKAMQNIQTLMP